MAREGDKRKILQEYVRHECECCGEPATKRHSYLLKGARFNPASAGYGRDDVSWCADDEAFTCDSCGKPSRQEMEWCSTFEGERFQHMLHFWAEIECEELNSSEAA